MPTLEKRVHVLFERETYARMEAAAAAERVSVGALIRDAVEDRLNKQRMTAQEALERLFARADAKPLIGAIDWEEEKDLMDRDILRDL